VQGDLTKIHCDARIVPAKYDTTAPHTESWYLDAAERDLARAAPVPPDWASLRTYRIDSTQPRSPTLWITKVAVDHPDDFAYAMESAREFLEHAAAHAATRRSTQRLLPLLAMHIPASGAKNAKSLLGDLVREVLAVVEGFVQNHAADVVLVVKDPAQYDALQAERQRRGTAWAALRATDLALAQDLARRRLSVFIGAGVSAGAGLLDWKALLRKIAENLGAKCEIDRILAAPGSGATRPEESPMLVAAQALAEECGDLKLRRQIVAACSLPRSGVAHFLLVNLRASEYVTLNYNTLLEQAAESYQRQLDVLPHRLCEGAKIGTSWLMKLHGCTRRPSEIVLTKDDYKKFDRDRKAFNGLVQGLLLTRHMLFVGFGLEDPNVQTLVSDLERAIRDAEVPTSHRLGTVLMVGSGPATARPAGYDWSTYFDVYDLFADGDTGFAPSARRGELFLDALVAHNVDRFAHLLDPNFDGLLSEDERAIRGIAERCARELRSEEPSTARDRILAKLAELGLKDLG
jgi:hypothetical protein